MSRFATMQQAIDQPMINLTEVRLFEFLQLNTAYYFDVVYVSASPDEDSVISAIAGPFMTLAKPAQPASPVLASRTATSLNITWIAPAAQGATIIG